MEDKVEIVGYCIFPAVRRQRRFDGRVVNGMGKMRILGKGKRPFSAKEEEEYWGLFSIGQRRFDGRVVNGMGKMRILGKGKRPFSAKEEEEYWGLFSIGVGNVAYELELPAELAAVHLVFHISLLKKCVGDPTSIVPLDSVDVKDSLTYEEEPVESLIVRWDHGPWIVVCKKAPENPDPQLGPTGRKWDHCPWIVVRISHSVKPIDD
ncbi:hypothetical protein MTR67_052039 [Solanum verrucosum]|uniref:Tf2-1-like SH3-like domain-containing protein n=1 Tax=Solanum verrucosum TaxID=315347 RepID=A0AAF1A380_SOLVR|nr:hypothetical protein MTR67_052039 [Solanum verrucosum]